MTEFGTVAGAWEQQEGSLGIYILFESGDLLIISVGGMSDVAVAVLPAARRQLREPAGIASASTAPWPEAVARGWAVHSIAARSDPSGVGGTGVRMLVGPGAVTIGTYPSTWREMGEYRYFLSSKWEPTC
jgi:hypothetical protein